MLHETLQETKQKQRKNKEKTIKVDEYQIFSKYFTKTTTDKRKREAHTLLHGRDTGRHPLRDIDVERTGTGKHYKKATQEPRRKSRMISYKQRTKKVK